MKKKTYNELQRLRRQEEVFIFMMLVVKPEFRDLEFLHENGYFGTISKRRMEKILHKLHREGLYRYHKNIWWGWAITDDPELKNGENDSNPIIK